MMQKAAKKSLSQRKSDVAPVLTERGWFSERTEAVQTRLAAVSRPRFFDRGAYVYRVDDPADGLYGLISGTFEITLPGDDGQEAQVHRAEPGFWVGDLALFADQPRLVTIRAIEPAETLFLPQAQLRRLVQDHPDMLRDFYDLTHSNMALALRLLANLSVAQSERRLGLRLLHYSELSGDPAGWLNIAQDELARLIAVSHPTMQRLLRRLADEGLVELGYGRLRILDPAGLEARCRD